MWTPVQGFFIFKLDLNWRPFKQGAVHCGLVDPLDHLKVVKGNAEDRKEHEKYTEGTHLMLLLQHVKQLKASLHPSYCTLDTHLIDSNVLMRFFLSMKLQGALATDCSSRLPLCERGTKARRHSWTANGDSLLEGKLQVFENIESVLSKEMVASWQKIVAFRSQSSLDQDMIRGLELKACISQPKIIVLFSPAMPSAERCSFELVGAETSVTRASVLGWCLSVEGYGCASEVLRRCVREAFYTLQYGGKLCMRIYLNGEGRNTPLTLSGATAEHDAVLQWPFVHKVTFTLLGQNDGDHLVNTLHPDLESSSLQKPVADMNESVGFPRFGPLAKLHSVKHAYLREGTLFLKCATEARS
ncbi:TNF receptor-associated factor 1 [Podarcis raffonei]|uniref:TNF receptor-associated factor 1 n=1 Tax=Podarcis raffonei TaxID=65483 RepID=UPI0023293FBC|nr:TNF receptor-associated factor 1 [Podarcis raffonei]